MSEKAKQYLLKILQIYKDTGKTEIDGMLVSGEPYNDYVFRELEQYGYIEFRSTIMQTVTVLPKAIALTEAR